MKLEQGLSQRPEQRLALLPKMIQSIEVLQLSSLELESLVQKELTENETLEISAPENEEKVPERADPRTLRKKGTKEDSDRHSEMLANAPAPQKTLKLHLLEQAAVLEVPARMKHILDYVIHNIDENGYLTASVDELVQGLAGEGREEEIKAAIESIRTMDPKGVGGRGPVECLLLQLDENEPEQRILRRVLIDFLEDVSKNRLPKVARAMGIDVDELKEILTRVRHLNPRPGSGFSGESVPPIRPDISVEVKENGLEVRIEDHFLPRLGVDSGYWAMSKDRATPSEVRSYLREKIDSARWLVQAIEQRRATLWKVSHLVFTKQMEFLEKGPRAIRPLMMKDIADELGIHVSTVSRAVSNKYAQTPVGIFPMRLFFNGATEGENETSRMGVREMVKELIAGEDPKLPLSDEDLVARLRAKGVEVARRTVAKYRTELEIPSSWRRKAY